MKRVYIPGRIWTDAKSFIDAFPFTKTSLAIMVAKYVHDKGWMVANLSKNEWTRVRVSDAISSGNTDGSFVGFKEQEGYYAHKDIVTYALGPDKPIDLRFDTSVLLQTQVAYPMFNGIFPRTSDPTYGTHAMDNNEGIIIWLVGRIQLYDKKTSITLSDDQARAFYGIKEMPTAYGLFLKTLAGPYENRVIENIDQVFTNFVARCEPEWVNFNEIYRKNISSVAEVPRNTICYTVTGLYPPVDEIDMGDGRMGKIDWDRVEPWSAVFSGEMGSAILNAVAKNMPVRIHTRVENWKDPTAETYSVYQSKGAITIHFTYVFQDFDVEIGTNNNILLRYNRGVGASEIYTRLQKSRWTDYLGYIGFVAVAAIGIIAFATAATAATAAGTAAASSAAGTGTGAAGAGAAATTTTAVAAPTAVAGSTGAAGTTGSALTSGLTLSGAGSTSAAGGALTLSGATGVAGGSVTGAAVATAAPVAAGGGGLTLGTVSTYAGYVSTAAGVVSKVAAAGGDQKTAQAAGAVSAVSGAVGGGTGAYAGGAGAFESVVEGATPLLGYAAQAYTTNQMKKLEGGPMMGDTPINGYGDPGFVDINKQPSRAGASFMEDIPMEYFAIGGLALAAVIIMTSPKGKGR